MLVTNFIAKIVIKIAKLFIPKVSAATYFPFMFMSAENAKIPYLVRHEQIHYLQWKRYWIVGYPFISLYHYAKCGYWNHPFEIEARAEAHKVYITSMALESVLNWEFPK